MKNTYCVHIDMHKRLQITFHKELNLFFLKLTLFREVPHKSVSSGWNSWCVNDAQPEVLTSDVPNIDICSFERVWKVSTQ